MTERLEALAAAYGLAGARVIAEVGERVWRIASDRGELAVKWYPPAEHARAEREAALLAHLAGGDGYRVQPLARTTAGDGAWRGPAASAVVTHWIPGEFRPYDQLALGDWRALGDELAALHDRLDTFPGAMPTLSAAIAARDVEREREALEACRARARQRDPARVDELSRHLDTQLALLDACADGARHVPDDPERPIHNDYNQYNYLWEAGLPPAILDWDRAIGAAREYEVVRCLNHLPLIAPDRAAAFVDGYLARRPLRRDALAWAVDAALVEHAIKRWPLERWLDRLPGAERQLAGSIEVTAVLARDPARLRAFFTRRGHADSTGEGGTRR